MRKKAFWVAVIILVLILLLLLLLWLLKRSKQPGYLTPHTPTPLPSPTLPPGQYSLSVTPDNTLQIKFNAEGTTVSATSVRLVYKFTGTPAISVVDQNPNKEGVQLKPNLELIQKNWSYLINSVDTFADPDGAGQLLIIDLAAAVLAPDGYTPQKEEILATAKLTISNKAANPKFKFDPAFTKLIEKSSAGELPLTFQD